MLQKQISDSKTLIYEMLWRMSCVSLNVFKKILRYKVWGAWNPLIEFASWEKHKTLHFNKSMKVKCSLGTFLCIKHLFEEIKDTNFFSCCLAPIALFLDDLNETKHFCPRCRALLGEVNQASIMNIWRSFFQQIEI